MLSVDAKVSGEQLHKFRNGNNFLFQLFSQQSAQICRQVLSLLIVSLIYYKILTLTE